MNNTSGRFCLYTKNRQKNKLKTIGHDRERMKWEALENTFNLYRFPVKLQWTKLFQCYIQLPTSDDCRGYRKSRTSTGYDNLTLISTWGTDHWKRCWGLFFRVTEKKCRAKQKCRKKYSCRVNCIVGLTNCTRLNGNLAAQKKFKIV